MTKSKIKCVGSIVQSVGQYLEYSNLFIATAQNLWQFIASSFPVPWGCLFHSLFLHRSGHPVVKICSLRAGFSVPNDHDDNSTGILHQSPYYYQLFTTCSSAFSHKSWYSCHVLMVYSTLTLCTNVLHITQLQGYQGLPYAHIHGSKLLITICHLY